MASDDTPTYEEIKDQVAADVRDGIQSFSDGTNSVTAMDPEKRLAAAKDIAKSSGAAQRGFGLGIRQIVPGGTG